MRRAVAAAAVAAALIATGCRKYKDVQPERPVEGGIPRTVALEQLSKLLPTAESIYCSTPRETMRPSEIVTWTYGDAAMELSDGDDAYRLVYDEITEVRLEQSGKYFYARVFSAAQPNPRKEHFHFRWLEQRAAEDAVELFNALKKPDP